MSISTLFFNSYIFRKLISGVTFSRILDSTGSDQGLSVTCDSSGNVYISGLYTGTPSIITQFGGTINILPPSTSGSNAAFVCKFDSSGTYQYSRIVDSNGQDIGRSIACDSSGNMYFSGEYNGTSPTIKDQDGNSLGTLPVNSSTASFMCKFDSSGTYQYSRVVDGTGLEVGFSVSCDPTGNVYFGGSYSGTPTVKDQTGASLFTSESPSISTLPTDAGVRAAFMCKFDSSGNYQYARIIDSTTEDRCYSVTCDSSGNVYMSGFYSGTPTIKNQGGTGLGTLPASAGQFSAVVCKFNSIGQYQYSRIVDGTGVDESASITCDSSDNMYLAGQYSGTPTIRAVNSSNVSTNVATLPASSGSTVAFVSKFNSIGVYQYSRIVDSAGADEGLGVACDSSGNMYLAGYYTGTPTIKDQANTSLGTLPVSTVAAAFVSKFDSSGTYQYSRIVDSAGADQGLGAACDSSGNMYISGYYTGTPTIKDQGGTTLAILPASTVNAALLVKFDSIGNYSPTLEEPTFSIIIDSTGADQGNGVACDSSGNMYISGFYTGTPSIKNQYGGTIFGTLPASTVAAAFVSKFDSSGNYKYSRIIDSAGADQGLGVACDSSGNMYISGFYTGTPTIKDQANTSLGTLPVSTVAAAFVSKFNSSGTYQYSRIIDSAGADQGLGVACDSSGNMYLAGFYTGTPTIKDQTGASLTAAIAPLVSTLPTPIALSVAFVSKFDSSGTYQYSRVFDGNGTDQGLGVACDSSGNMYLAGQYSGSTGTPTIKDQGGNSLGTLQNSVGIASIVSKFDSGGTYQYSRIIDASNNDAGFGVACDSSGNMYLAGQYQLTTPNVIYRSNLNVSTTVATLPASVGTFTTAFVSKFDSTGTYQYSRIIEAANGDIGYGVACDSTNSVYIAGLYTGTPNIIYRNISNVSTTVGSLPTSTNEAAFLTKFDSSGNYQYSRIIDVIGFDSGQGVACDSTNNVYLTGLYAGTVTNIIKNEVGSTLGTLPITAGGNVAFVCKFNSDGSYYPPPITFSRIIDAANNDVGYGVTTDSSGSVILSGMYNGTPTIKNQAGTSLGTLPASAAGINTGFLSKFDQTGTYSFSRIVSSTTGTIFISSVTCDAGSNIYAMGYYNAAATIRNQAGTSLGTLPNLGDGAFLMKFNSAGAYQWTRIVTSGPVWAGNQCTVDSSNNVYMCGYYNTSGGIYNQAGTFIDSLVGAGSIASFTVKFDTTGTLLYSFNLAGTTGSGAFGISSDSNSDVGISGNFAGTSCTIVRRTAGVNVTLGTLPSVQSFGSFVCRFDSSGNLRHSFVIDSVNNDNCHAVAFDSSRNMYATGYYNGTTSNIFAVNSSNVSTIVGSLPSTTSDAAFVSKFNSSGMYQYSRIVDSVGGGDIGFGLACDIFGNMYFGGYYTGTPSVKNQAGTTLATLPASSDRAAFVSKFDSTGTYQYSRIVDTSGGDEGYSLTCDAAGNMYLAGYYTGTPTIKDQSGNLLGTLPASTGNAAFLCKFNPDGTYAV